MLYKASDSENHILNQSNSYSCISASSTNSITSSSSSINVKSCCSSSSLQKRFHSSHLGRPSGLISSGKVNTQITPSKPTTVVMPPKIAPLKEVEKLLSDLKKENFDLKLKIYHLQDLVTKDLNEENYQLRLALEDKDKRLKEFEQNERLTTPISKGTQTIPPKKITFESSPEAFNLLPAPCPQSWQKVVANENHLSSVVHALQEIKIDTHDVESWVNQTVTNHQQGTLRRPCI